MYKLLIIISFFIKLAASAQLVLPIDSNFYQSKWKSDTGKSNIYTVLAAKQATLVSATNIKTVNGNSLLGSGDIAISGSAAWGSVTGTLSNQTDLQTALNGKAATATTLAGYGITDGQPLNTNLTTIAGLTATTDNFIVSAASAWASRTPAQAKTSLALNNVENTALSTWAGTANITTLGTIGTGTWNATAIADGKIASALTGKTYNGLTLTSTTGTFTLTNGKTLSVSNSLTLAGTDGTTITFPSTNATIARTDAAQTFSGQSTFAGGLINSGSGAITAATSAIANTDTKILSTTTAMVASRLVAGTVIEVLLHGTATSTAAGAGTITVRYGTAGTTSDGALQAFALAAAPTSGTNVPFTIRIFITIRTTGASATSDGELDLVNNGTTGLSATATQVIRGTATNINTTTASTFLTVSYISGNASTAATFQDAVITILNK